MLNMNRERMKGGLARGCARNSSVKGGSYNYTIGHEPLIPGRPDLPVYQSGAGYGVDVSSDIGGMPVYTRLSTGLPCGEQPATRQAGGRLPATGQAGGRSPATGQAGGRSPATGQAGGRSLATGQAGGRSPATGQAGGRYDLIDESVAGYTFQPSHSEAPYMDVIATSGRACSVVGPTQTGGSGGCAVFGDSSAAEWGNPTKSVFDGGSFVGNFIKNTKKRVSRIKKLYLAPTIKNRRTKMNTSRKRKYHGKKTKKQSSSK